MKAIIIGVVAIGMVAISLFVLQLPKAVATEVVMHKSPNCECCTGWADHLRGNGFTVIEKKHENMDEIKATLGMPKTLASCHTGVVGGYLIEGHVPAADVTRLLQEKPDVLGLTAPGMPMKSPGMQEKQLEPKGYDVLAIKHDGSTYVYAHY